MWRDSRFMLIDGCFDCYAFPLKSKSEFASLNCRVIKNAVFPKVFFQWLFGPFMVKGPNSKFGLFEFVSHFG